MRGVGHQAAYWMVDCGRDFFRNLLGLVETHDNSRFQKWSSARHGSESAGIFVLVTQVAAKIEMGYTTDRDGFWTVYHTFELPSLFSGLISHDRIDIA